MEALRRSVGGASAQTKAPKKSAKKTRKATGRILRAAGSFRAVSTGQGSESPVARAFPQLRWAVRIPIPLAQTGVV